MQVTTSNQHEPQGHTNQQGTRRHEPARHEVQGMQVTTSNQHTNHKARGDTNQQAQGSRRAGNHFQPAGTRFKVCR